MNDNKGLRRGVNRMVRGFNKSCKNDIKPYNDFAVKLIEWNKDEIGRTCFMFLGYQVSNPDNNFLFRDDGFDRQTLCFIRYHMFSKMNDFMGLTIRGEHGSYPATFNEKCDRADYYANGYYQKFVEELKAEVEKS